jgi:hypothetical protein
MSRPLCSTEWPLLHQQQLGIKDPVPDPKFHNIRSSLRSTFRASHSRALNMYP